MIRRAFLKGSVAAVAAVCAPLSAEGFISDSRSQKKIAFVSKTAGETGYINALSQGHSTKTDDLIVLGSDKLQNLTTFSEVMKNNKGALICGLLEQSDYMLLHHIAAVNGAKFISETTHTPADQRTRHTENSFLTLSVKKAFDQFVDVHTNQYGMALSSYHALGLNTTVADAQHMSFVSNHTAKNAFVSFILNA